MSTKNVDLSKVEEKKKKKQYTGFGDQISLFFSHIKFQVPREF